MSDGEEDRDDSAEWLRNLAMNYADAQPGMRPEDHPAWDIAAEIERQHKQIDDAEAEIERLTADEEQLRTSAKEDAAEIDRLQADNDILRRMLNNIAKHPDCSLLIKQYAAGLLAEHERRALEQKP